MRLAAICVIVLVATGTIASAQKPTKDGVPQSRYASPKVHKTSSSGPAVRTTNSNAAELAKIEQQTIKAQTASTKAKHAVPLSTAPAENKNKPMRLAAGSHRSAKSTGNQGGGKLH